ELVLCFVQAEDGIRDRNVTGVQTCALPILCGVVASGQVFLSLLAAYAFSRLRFRGRRGGMLAVLLIMMFPAILSMIAVYTMIAGLGEAVPLLGLNTLAGYIAVLMGGA